MNKVKAPAIKTPSGRVVTAKGKAQHHDDIPAKGQRGFKMTDGSFKGRVEAGKVAKRAGQVKRMEDAPRLHSEDLPGRKRK